MTQKYMNGRKTTNTLYYSRPPTFNMSTKNSIPSLQCLPLSTIIMSKHKFFFNFDPLKLASISALLEDR